MDAGHCGDDAVHFVGAVCCVLPVPSPWPRAPSPPLDELGWDRTRFHRAHRRHHGGAGQPVGTGLTAAGRGDRVRDAVLDFLRLFDQLVMTCHLPAGVHRCGTDRAGGGTRSAVPPQAGVQFYDPLAVPHFTLSFWPLGGKRLGLDRHVNGTISWMQLTTIHFAACPRALPPWGKVTASAMTDEEITRKLLLACALISHLRWQLPRGNSYSKTFYGKPDRGLRNGNGSSRS